MSGDADDADDADDKGSRRPRPKWQVALTAVAGALFLVRAVVYLLPSDHHSRPSADVTFPVDGVYTPGAVPSDVLTALPSLNPLDPDLSGIASDAPTAVTVGPVTYEVTGARSSLVEYSDADLVLVHVAHPRLPYRKTIDSGVGDYFTIFATSSTSAPITCRILAHHGTVEVTRTARGSHAQVHCGWTAPST